MMQWQGAIAEERDPISQRDTAMWERKPEGLTF